MILVVLGHTLLRRTAARKIIYEFHIPLFYMLSGMVLKSRDPDCPFAQVLRTIGKRAKTYLVPYVIWSLFYTTLGSKNLVGILLATRETLVEIEANAMLWYLPVLFLGCSLCELTLWLLRRLKGRALYGAVAVAAILLGAVGLSMPHLSPYGWPFALDISIVASAFMLLGFLARKLADRYFQGLGAPAAVFAASLLLFALGNRLFPSDVRVNMSYAQYGNIATFLLLALLGCAMGISASVVLDHLPLKNRPLRYLGQNTMGVLVLHRPLLFRLARTVRPYHLYRRSLPSALLQSLVNISICLAVSALLVRIVPALMGKEPPGDAARKRVA